MWHYVYTENGSKNRSGGLWQLCVENNVPIIAKPELGVHCHVALLDKYISKLSPKAHKLDCFYMKPLVSKADPSKPWFASQPCGANKLSAMVRGNKSQPMGHKSIEDVSCWCTRKEVQECTGHRCVKALRTYI